MMRVLQIFAFVITVEYQDDVTVAKAKGFVDLGLLRAGERAQVQRDFVAATGANLVTVDAENRFLEALGGAGTAWC